MLIEAISVESHQKEIITEKEEIAINIRENTGSTMLVSSENAIKDEIKKEKD